MSKYVIIPVTLQGDRCVVWESDIESEGKLRELYAYIGRLPKTFDNMIGMLLSHVGDVIKSGTNVYVCNIGVDIDEYGELVFVQSQFRTAGMTICWQTIADNISDYVEEAFK
jgi:hypothetical protein